MTDHYVSPAVASAAQSTRKPADVLAASHMAGSLLPSHNSQTLQPMQFKGRTFKVKPLQDIETYALTVDGAVLAMHPNGHSLKELADRIGRFSVGTADRQRVLDQWNYILACGGLTRSQTALDHYLDS